MQSGIAAYLRNLSVRSSKIAKTCADPKIKSDIENICAEITEKAEVLESLFEVPATMK
jgi:hypothetical protein